MQCPRCEGTGQCSECQGLAWVTCVNCEGSGQRASSRGASYPCRNCKGSGRAECSPRCASCEGSGEITAQLQAKVREKYEVRFDNTAPLSRITNVVGMLCICVYLVGAFSPPAKAWMDANLSDISGLWNQPWRLLTSAFLHAGLLHLLFNLSMLLRFGPLLEGYYGSRRFALLYLLSALGGSALSSAAHQALGNAVLSLGASGALFGLFGAVCGAHQRYHLFNARQVRDQLIWLVVYTGVALTWVASIDHWAHLGGFLAGFAYSWFSRRPSGR